METVENGNFKKNSLLPSGYELPGKLDLEENVSDACSGTPRN